MKFDIICTHCNKKTVVDFESIESCKTYLKQTYTCYEGFHPYLINAYHSTIIYPREPLYKK